MKEVRIYTDGACSGNPGPGGWGAILVCTSPPLEKEISGGELVTTNNRMELTAIVEALALLRTPCEVTIVTDSQYVANAFRKDWISGWLKNGWKTANKKPVKNQDLWRRLLDLIKRHKVRWEWIRGHAGHPENERADRLAVAACEAIAKEEKAKTRREKPVQKPLDSDDNEG